MITITIENIEVRVEMDTVNDDEEIDSSKKVVDEDTAVVKIERLHFKDHNDIN